MTIAITTHLTDDQAEALAQLVKRIGWADMRQLAVSDEEAYLMRDAIDQLTKSLRAAGFAPR